MSNIKIEFISEFNDIKKGDVKEFSKDICNIFVNELKVAKYLEIKASNLDVKTIEVVAEEVVKSKNKTEKKDK